MTQKTITVVIDAFSDAIARVADHTPPDVVAQLHIATADLLEALSTAAQAQASQYAALLRHKVEAMQVEQDADHLLLEAIDARTDRRHTPRKESE